MEIISLLRFLILLSVLIFVHEGGHFLFAKKFGVKVEEFGFGLPPRLWGKKIKDTIYSLNLLPLGGFVRLKGEEQAEALGLGQVGSFAIQSKWKRAVIIAAGAFGNFLLAWLLFSALLVIGNPVPAGKVAIGAVAQNSPAAQIGLDPGDFILSFNGEKVETAGELVGLTNQNIGKLVVFEIEEDGQVRLAAAIPRENPPEGEGRLGIQITTAIGEEKFPLWQVPFIGLQRTVEALGAMVVGLGQAIADLFAGKEVAVGGPVAIYALTESVANGGFKIFLQFVALLSLNLVVVNLLPIPALDGGRILFIGIEAIRRKKLSPRTEHLVNSIGFAFLLALIVLISIRDIGRFF
ncbi:hypothetical protein A2797_00210 [candidate division WWE3 bacterium RIFCSPHIGHO2_01_FULL_48_15]|uniref:PDZ domain-containing protein n=1 Tax=candidate division WWE3 bacterium RIFCSPHIGHO2_01_FULL_48_15 TaxID=1802619 RepID=A0A1F4VAH6_UNCKA|nr:MAG: hypothetical protein A2797_00210 [candidate division WWE3 bacterium RIFCSPHIGHO2_01_FULL_48_15]